MSPYKERGRRVPDGPAPADEIMALHMLKMAVGIDTVGHLAAVQKRKMARAKGGHGASPLRHFTRNAPRRWREILDGGSIYWIIKGAIRVRQRILGIDRGTDVEGRRYCQLSLDPALVRTTPRPNKALQGWRYLENSGAPMDLDAGDGMTGDMPADMVAELRTLGLL